MRRQPLLCLVLPTLLASGCASVGPQDAPSRDALIGAWRARIQFSSGAFAGIRDLEFMLAFNAGGTLTESSNYDGAPPVPPAYGTWRRTASGHYEAVYEYYATRAPARLDDLTTGGGWLPAGRGRFVERIVVAADGRSYRSTLTYTALDANDLPIAGGGEAEASATRIGF